MDEHKDKLKIMQKIVTEEFELFKEELIKGKPKDIFDRSQEILMKCLLADEILNDFQATIDFDGDKTLLTEQLWEICTQPNTNLLDTLYQDWIMDLIGLFDSDLLGEFFYTKYC